MIQEFRWAWRQSLRVYVKQLSLAWFGLDRRSSIRPAGVFLTRDLGGSATQNHPPQHHAKFTNFSRDLGGSAEGNSVGASFCLRCSCGNFGSKRVFWHKTRNCRTAGAGRSVSLQPPAVALRKIYKLKSGFRRLSRKEFVRCIFLSTTRHREIPPKPAKCLIRCVKNFSRFYDQTF